MSPEVQGIFINWARNAIIELKEHMRHPQLHCANQGNWERALETIRTLEMVVQDVGVGVDLDSPDGMLGTTTLREELAALTVGLYAILRLVMAFEEFKAAAAECSAVSRTPARAPRLPNVSVQAAKAGVRTKQSSVCGAGARVRTNGINGVRA